LIVLDTTVLAYALGGEHPLQQPSRSIVAALGNGDLRATTTAEVIQELLHVRARRGPRSAAVAEARDAGTLMSPLIAVDEDDLAEGFEVFTSTTTLGAFDAILAGAARRRGARLVSADRSFREVPDLDVVDLNDDDVLEQL
jgi:predicted nucleic acid-binding protein